MQSVHAFLYLNVYEMSQFPSKQSRPRPLPPKRKCYPVCGCVFRILNNWVSGVSILLDLCVSECATLVLCVCVQPESSCSEMAQHSRLLTQTALSVGTFRSNPAFVFHLLPKGLRQLCSCSRLPSLIRAVVVHTCLACQ